MLPLGVKSQECVPTKITDALPGRHTIHFRPVSISFLNFYMLNRDLVTKQ